MEKLDHEHIVKLVGTYCTRPNELYLLLWPVAVCNLDNLFDDLDSLLTGQGDRDEILKRLETLGVPDARALERNSPRQSGQSKTTATSSRGNCPLKYLQQIIGCISRAVAYCHGANIRHLDLKPSNILLSPGRVYLADFGIAKDVNDRDQTKTIGVQGTPKWRAPEICDPDDEWSMKAADVYSLGLVLLNIATVLYGAEMADFDRVVDELNPRSRAQKLSQFYPTLEALAMASHDVRDAKAHTFAPRHIVDLVSRMLSSEPAQRPTAGQAEAELTELGGIEQIYHSPCCKRNTKSVTERMDARYKAVVDQRDDLAANCQVMGERVEALKRAVETYEERIQNERKAHALNISHLQEQLDTERKERSRLEALLAERKRRQDGIPRPRKSAPGGHNDASSGPGVSANARARPHPHPLPATASPASFPSASAPALKAPMRPLVACAATRALQPTYSQAAAGGKPCPATALRSAASRAAQASPTRAPTATATGIPSPSPTPNPNGAGFPLRSRGSGSRLPRLVTPTTPIRSGTPTLQRDPSLTDSTQYSMSSSTFSRLSGLSRESESEIGSPAVQGAASTPSKDPARTQTQSIVNARPADAEPQAPELAGAVGLGLVEMNATAKEQDTSSRNTRDRDSSSVVGAPAPGSAATSPLLTASALSSPRSVKAELHPVAMGGQVPSLPMAKSWADVARRERRG